jgi:hypothetical protein
MFGPASVARAAGPIAGTPPAAPAYEFVRSLTCTNLNDVSVKLAGPGGISATLKIFTGDDGAKEYHNCGIGVWIDMPNRKETGAGNVYTSDGDYGRAFSIRVAGFSPDGRGIVGVIADWGESTDLFRYDLAADHTDDADLTSYLTRLRAAKCGKAIDIAGMTRSGLIVVQPAAGSGCNGKHRTSIDARSGHSIAWTQAQGLVPVFRAGGQ